MIPILKIPESVLTKSTAVFTTYNYIVANRYKRSKTIKVTYETLARQMDIHMRHVKTYVKELVDSGLIKVSEPNIKQNGRKGAITITLIAEDKHYVILPQEIMLDDTIPKTFRQYYARFKRVINLNTFTTFKSPTELQEALGCKERTYWEFMNLMKNTKISGQALILDESNGKEYKFIMEYDRYVAGNHRDLSEIKENVRKNNVVKFDESSPITL